MISVFLLYNAAVYGYLHWCHGLLYDVSNVGIWERCLTAEGLHVRVQKFHFSHIQIFLNMYIQVSKNVISFQGFHS